MIILSGQGAFFSILNANFLPRASERERLLAWTCDVQARRARSFPDVKIAEAEAKKRMRRIVAIRGCRERYGSFARSPIESPGELACASRSGVKQQG